MACVVGSARGRQEQQQRYGAQLWVSLLDNVGKEAGLQQQLLYLVQAYNAEHVSERPLPSSPATSPARCAQGSFVVPRSPCPA